MTKALEGGVVTFLTALVLAVVLFPASIVAHPGSGIVVDRHGEVYFIDTGAGVWKIDLHGKLTRLPGPRFHWMALDADDSFRNVTLPAGTRGDIERVGATLTLLVASDYLIAIGSNGNLFYPSYA